MFLLKNLERRRGVSFVRFALQSPPLNTGKWLRAWKNRGDVGLMRFLGDNKLPRHNPFIGCPLWNEVHPALSAGLTPGGSFKTLENVIMKQAAQPELLKSALLACVFHEAFLLQVLPEIPDVTRKQIRALQHWIVTSRHLSFLNDRERELVHFFAGGAPARPNAATKFLALDHKSSPEHIALVRVIAHAAIVALSAGPNNLFRFLGTLISSPSTLIGAYLPCQPEDVQAMAVRVLGGRWYTCPNGHAYYVDQCGRPTRIQKCGTCGVDIGGTDHNLLDSNKDLDTKLQGNTNYSQKSNVDDKSEKGYCFRTSEEEKNPFDTVRGLTPISTRTQRFLLHASLTVSALVGGAAWSKTADALINKAYCNPRDPAKYFVDHCDSDWKVLRSMIRRSVDDLAMLIHLTVLSIEQDQKTGQNILLSDQKTPRNFQLFRNLEERSAWEEDMKKHCESVIAADGVAGRLENAAKEFGSKGDEEGSIFVAELLEQSDLATMEGAVRKEAWPALWRYRRPFSLEDFTMELNLNAENAKAYPVLSAFLAEEPQLRALQDLTNVIGWMNLLMSRYNRTFTDLQAKEKTVRDLLEMAPSGEKHKWRHAFAGFKAAWNKCWQYVKRFECIEIPQQYQSVVMSEDQPIGFSLPTNKDEGICGIALTRFLGEKHNRVIEMVDELLLMRGETLQRAEDKDSKNERVVTTKFLAPAHTISYDLEGGFIPFVEKQCVEYTAAGGLTYDFKNAEQYLLDVYFTGKPLINIEMRMFQFANEAGALSTALLKQKVAQEALPRDIQTAILKELGSPSQGRKALELLETCIQFLQATGGAANIQQLDVGEIKLGDYVKSVLMMKEAEFGSNIISSRVLLKHIDSLWRLLRDYTVVNPFANVRPRYKAPLDGKQKEKLLASCAKLDLVVLLPLMKDMIVSSLNEDTFGTEAKLKDSLAYLTAGDVFLADLPWFEHFPDDLHNKHFLESFKVLEQSSVE